MAQINILLEKQLLTIQNREIIASGDSNYDSCVFTFDETWEGFAKTAVFYQDKTSVQYAVLDKDDRCIIPSAAMNKEGKMYIGVFGIKETAVLTSTLEYIEIAEGSISGDNISTEPTDDVFLSIIAQYQRVIEMMRKYEIAAGEINTHIVEQNKLLETLNAFDVTEIKQQLELIEDRMLSYSNIAKEVLERELLLRDVIIKFTNRVCIIRNEYITETSLCDVYFDEYSYEIASNILITAVTFNGYMELTSSGDINEELIANILIRRY